MQKMDYLGECPVWDAHSQTLYWIDLIGRRLHKLKWGKLPSAPLDLNVEISAITMWKSDLLLAVTSRGDESLDPATGELVLLLPPPWSSAETPNDAKCDPQGRLWFGTKDLSGGVGAGGIYCIAAGGNAQMIERGFGNINGFGWSPDGAKMYVTDTRRSEIYSCAFEARTGKYTDRQKLVRLGARFGRPDGLTVDKDGFIWSANWAGACIARHDPRGSQPRIHMVEARCPTSCTFGGPNLDTLYVTVATDQSEPNYLKLVQQPLALAGIGHGCEEHCFQGY